MSDAETNPTPPAARPPMGPLKRRLRRLASTVFALSLGLIGLWLASHGWAKWQQANHQEAIRLTGQALTAEVLKTDAPKPEAVGDGPGMYTLTYRYAFDGTPYENEAESYRDFGHAIGDTFPVWVDPAEPTRHTPGLAHTNAAMTHRQAGWILVASGLCVLFAFGVAAGALERTSPDAPKSGPEPTAPSA